LFSYQLFHALVFLVQKEVGWRWVAHPNKYSAFSVFINYLTTTFLAFDIPRQIFVPPSSVESSLIVIKNHFFIDLNKKQLSSFWKFLKICFCFRRKTLWNNLKSQTNSFQLQLIENYWKEKGYSINVRPQNLTPNEYYRLFEYWSKIFRTNANIS
jgi:16S rRNA (adenine1518-N6/adenine1519-N6)-dimethyltransferase